ncbi:hypothetical protein [Pseudomonas paeninsulae]|uniref:hypothetical protein n=1 Tax=Pseudomonas paeninsulae TaxID=3110772 RepID=UPI002D76752F|nr:hypothetical protein [Pseudomonas sp. IT1137]
MSDWEKAKAEKFLRFQVEVIAQSAYPDGGLAHGAVEAYYAIGLISDAGLGYWRQTIDNTVIERRAELLRQRHAELQERMA